MKKNKKNKKFNKTEQNYGMSKDKMDNKVKTTETKKTTFDWTSYKIKEEPYVYKGVKNKTAFPDFIDLCKASQQQLRTILPIKLLNAGYREVFVNDGYIYAKGEIPILVTAHMDTVHKEPVRDFYEYIDELGCHVLSSPQGIGGDDRCGIYMILQLIKEYKPYVLFCEDEETGGIGSEKFCRSIFMEDLMDLRFMIELDRANNDDAVFYDCDNPEFVKFIEEVTGYKDAWGSFSDISNLAPEAKVAAVNLSCGYYHAHTLKEEVNVEDMLYTIEMVKRLLTTESKQFEYIERRYGKYDNNWSYGKHSSYGSYSSKSSTTSKYDWYDYYEDDYYFDVLADNMDETEICEGDKVILYVYFYDKDYSENYQSAAGRTEDEAWGRFFKSYPYVSYNDVLDHEIDFIK